MRAVDPPLPGIVDVRADDGALLDVRNISAACSSLNMRPMPSRALRGLPCTISAGAAPGSSMRSVAGSASIQRDHRRQFVDRQPHGLPPGIIPVLGQMLAMRQQASQVSWLPLMAGSPSASARSTTARLCGPRLTKSPAIIDGVGLDDRQISQHGLQRGQVAVHIRDHREGWAMG